MADYDDDVDIYGDLTNFGEKSSEDCFEDALELKKKCTDLEDKVANLEKELESLRTIKNTLEVNLSSLVKTAKTEIARKDRMITELRAEVENSLFRRGNYRIPKINRNNDANNTPTVKPTGVVNSTTRGETASTHVDSIEPTCLKSFTPVDNDRDNDDDDDHDGGGEIYQPNKFASTVYGERLRKKIMEQDAAEKLEKEQLKLDSLASVKSENKNEPKTNFLTVNRDNKENHFNQIASNADNVEIPTKKSLKRSNDEVLNGHNDKRKKMINNGNENIDIKTNDKLELLNIREPHEKIDKKTNYRLEPIELRLLSLSQRHDGESSFEKQSNDLRDDYRDKYRRRRSSSRSRSSDSNRKNSSSRSKESNRPCDFDRSDHYRSSTNRFIQSKSENRRDPRDKMTEKSSGGSRREMDSRNHTNYYGSRRTDRGSNRRFETMDKRESHERRERCSRSQYDRGRKNIDVKQRNRSRCRTETFSDKSNDSVILKTFEPHISPKVKHDVVMENKIATSTNSLEEGEIVSSSKSIPQKDVFNTVISEKEFDKTAMHKRREEHLLVTLSVDTEKNDIANRNYPKSPQEENIENIAGFIRNFTYSASNNISSSMQIELPGSQSDSPGNIPKRVAEALEREANETTRTGNSENIGVAQNIVELCNHNNDNQEQRELPPLRQTPPDILECKDRVDNLLCESKVTETSTISINKISTPYADVLSKYVRRKRKSTTSDGDAAIPEEDLSLFTERSDTKDADESGTIINNGSPVCSKQNQDNIKHEHMQKKKDEIPVAVVIEPLRHSPCGDDATSATDSLNTSEIPKNLTSQEKIHVVEIISVKLETSEVVAKLPNRENCIDYSGIETVRKNETGDIAEESRKLTSVNNVLIPGGCNRNNDPVHQAVCTSTNSSGELCSTGKPTIGITDAENNADREGNKSVETEEKKSSKLQLENTCEQKCEQRTVNNTEYRINSCNKIVPTSTQNEKKIVVARQKKRPVQLTNSSNSLTVVLSAYNVKNNRICKSRMKTPVTLSDT